MRPVLLDTSLYIGAFRQADRIISAMRFEVATPLWLSAVVLEELHAGARTADRRVLDRMEHDFERARRIVVPNLTDWVQTGQILSRLANRYGYEQIGRARLTNDALIAMSAARLGITILTANARDFARLSEFRRFDWKVWSAT
jgi:predicted nucleic acid-binding protein